jgi:hypothetical protein
LAYCIKKNSQTKEKRNLSRASGKQLALGVPSFEVFEGFEKRLNRTLIVRKLTNHGSTGSKKITTDK